MRFKSDDVRKLFYSKVKAVAQMYIHEAFKTITTIGLRMTVDEVKNDDGKLEVIIRVHD